MQPRSIFSALMATVLIALLPAGGTLAAKKALPKITNLADAGGPYSGVVGEPVQFDGSGTVEQQGANVTYRWTFGETGVGAGVKPSYVFNSGGEQPVTLSVYYDGVLAGVSQTSATIAGNERPVAVLFETYKAKAGEPIEFDGSRSYDPDGQIVGYAWDFGDGTKAEGVRPVHSYIEPQRGSYVVTLVVTDDQGLSSVIAGTSVKVTSGNRAPVADVGVQGAHTTVGSTVTFDASASHDSDGTVDLYDWDFGDGAQGSGQLAAHAYHTAGSYDVKLRVTDNEGASNEDVTSATVYNAAQPTVIRFRAPRRVKLDGGTLVTESLSLTAAVYGAEKSDRRCGVAHLEGSNGASYQSPVCFTGDGKRNTVSFDHVFGAESTETIVWNAWLELDTGERSQRVSKVSQLVFR